MYIIYHYTVMKIVIASGVKRSVAIPMCFAIAIIFGILHFVQNDGSHSCLTIMYEKSTQCNASFLRRRSVIFMTLIQPL